MFSCRIMLGASSEYQISKNYCYITYIIESFISVQASVRKNNIQLSPPTTKELSPRDDQFLSCRISSKKITEDKQKFHCDTINHFRGPEETTKRTDNISIIGKSLVFHYKQSKCIVSERVSVPENISRKDKRRPFCF